MDLSTVLNALDHFFTYPLFTVNQTPITLSSLAFFAFIMGGFMIINTLIRRFLSNQLLKRSKMPKATQYTLTRIIQYFTAPYRDRDCLSSHRRRPERSCRHFWISLRRNRIRPAKSDVQFHRGTHVAVRTTYSNWGSHHRGRHRGRCGRNQHTIHHHSFSEQRGHRRSQFRIYLFHGYQLVAR